MLEYSPIDLYYAYPYWFDFFIAFFIFLGIAATAFSKQFKEGSKGVVFGIALMLSFGLIYWEMVNDFTLLAFGFIAVAILFLIMYFILYKIIRQLTKSMFSGICLGYSAAYIIFFYVLGFIPYYWSEGFYSFLNLLFWLGLILGIVGLFFKDPK